MKKVFLILMLGSPFPWIEQYINSVQHLEKTGWYFKIFTPNPIQSKGNVEIVPMTAEQFNVLTKQKIGVEPRVWITPSGVPSKHVTDFIVAHGAIFEDYTKGFDYWGHVGLDNVIGNLSKFIPDEELSKHAIWSDDIGVVNGNFVLVRNDLTSNRLFMHIPGWQEILSGSDCPRCTGTGTEHVLAGTDEYGMTEAFKETGIQLGGPARFFIHSHDRLIQHQPINLLRDEDGTLWEKFKDVKPPNWIHFHDAFAKEIAYFHFQMTKAWPL